MAVQTTYPREPDVAYAGNLVKNDRSRPMFNVAGASVPFGIAVAFKAASAGQEAVFPTGTLEIAGIVIRDLSHTPAFATSDGSFSGDLDAIGLKPGAGMDVLEDGEIWAVCVDGCNAGDRLWVVKADGALRASDAGAGTCTDATAKGRWVTKAVAGEKARLEVNFTTK